MSQLSVVVSQDIVLKCGLLESSFIPPLTLHCSWKCFLLSWSEM